MADATTQFLDTLPSILTTGRQLEDGPIQWTDTDSTILLTLWADGSFSVATRDHADGVWGPPIDMKPAS